MMVIKKKYIYIHIYLYTHIYISKLKKTDFQLNSQLLAWLVFATYTLGKCNYNVKLKT